MNNVTLIAFAGLLAFGSYATVLAIKSNQAETVAPIATPMADYINAEQQAMLANSRELLCPILEEKTAAKQRKVLRCNEFGL